MTYSRKGRWLATGGCLLLPALFIAGARLGHWEVATRGVVAILVFTAAGALGIRAFLFMDEIQKQARMREWYFGSLMGFLPTVILVICTRMFPASFFSWVHSTQIHLVSPDQALIIGLAAGVVMTLGMQTLCALAIRVITFARRRT